MSTEHWFDCLNKALSERTPRRPLVAAATALVATLGLGAVPIAEAAKSGKGRRGKGKSKRKRKGKKSPVCTCPTAEATSCTEAKVKHTKAKSLAQQACNYAGRCQPGVVG